MEGRDSTTSATTINVWAVFLQEVESRKELAPKAEEEGAESSSSEANGPVASAAPTSTSTANQRGGSMSETGYKTVELNLESN